MPIEVPHDSFYDSQRCQFLFVLYPEKKYKYIIQEVLEKDKARLNH